MRGDEGPPAPAAREGGGPGDGRSARGDDTALIPFRGGTATEQAFAWGDLPPDELHRRAVIACRRRDVPALQSLTVSWVLLHGRAGARTSPGTLRHYRTGVAQLLRAWAREELLRPGRNAGVVYLRRLEAAGLLTATVRVRLAAARALYAALRWSGATAADPFADAHPVPDPTPRHDKRAPYEPAEIDALLRHAADPEDRALVLLAAEAGLRVSECLALTWRDVDRGRRTLRVVGRKGGKSRTIPLARRVVQALDRLTPGADPHVIASYRSTDAARYRVERLAAAAGVAYHGVHALRHACATRLVRRTGNLEDAAHLLGHASIETTRVYAKWSNERLRTAIDEW